LLAISAEKRFEAVRESPGRRPNMQTNVTDPKPVQPNSRATPTHIHDGVADPKSMQSNPSAIPVETDIRQAIRERAFQIFQERGRQPGHEKEDWIQAEQEIRADLERAGRRALRP
jgi:hypothetical protein